MDKQQTQLKFPDSFLWGTSTSAYQVEGGIINDWSEFEKSEDRRKKLEKKGKNQADYICGQACDSYHRYEEDFDLAKSLNTTAVRFGIEWARIESIKGTWNVAEISHYREVLRAAQVRGLKTVVTLWHWTVPAWFAAEGGWAARTANENFLRFVDLIIAELGGNIDYWVTLNEPMVHVANGYLKGKFPPAKHNPFQARRAFHNLAQAHNSTYKKIHDYFPQAQVGTTALLNYFAPARKFNLIEQVLAKIFHYYWNHKFLKKIARASDFFGFDYYFHDRIVCYPPFRKNLNKKKSDIGWEIYPEGIYHILKYLAKFKKPIFVMENGLADAADSYRADFIRDHLRFVQQAIQEGVDVRGYFYWSLLDNFEWADGYAPKFGLFAVDRATFARIKRPSADVYADICHHNGL